MTQAHDSSSRGLGGAPATLPERKAVDLTGAAACSALSAARTAYETRSGPPFELADIEAFALAGLSDGFSPATNQTDAGIERFLNHAIGSSWRLRWAMRVEGYEPDTASEIDALVELWRGDWEALSRAYDLIPVDNTDVREEIVRRRDRALAKYRDLSSRRALVNQRPMTLPILDTETLG